MSDVVVVEFGRQQGKSKMIEDIAKGISDDGAELVDLLGREETHAEGLARCLERINELRGPDKESRRDTKNKKEQAHFDAKSRF